jgi:hypothetical protein
MEESLYSRRAFAVVRSWIQPGIVAERAGLLSRSMRGGKECEERSAPGYKRIESEPAVKRKKLTDTLTSRELASEGIDDRV